ncbi:MAG TPA: hybrid sensor histidine kinase/response regulator [Methanoregula sp.]|nr:hybrid sensor histidine kinase/response regulator [Methanoregula sp.]
MISVLCVDGDPVLLGECRQFLLEGGGISVDTAGSAAGALGMLAGKQYDAIIAGCRMPASEGIGLLKTLRRTGSPVPFIVTGGSNDEGAAGALESGADVYLRSCGDPRAQFGELRSAILAAVGRKKAETALRQSEESLRIANQMLVTISSATRHDVNNKLTIISGYMQLMRLENPGERVTEYIAIMERAVSDISKLLKFSKEYEKIGASPPVWQDLHAVIRKALTGLPLGGVGFTDTTGGVEVRADPLLGQVFTNLVQNALLHGGRVTALRARTEPRGPDLFLIFEDDGQGISPEQKERIFLRGAGRNTGLGLAFSREILSVTGLEIRETGEPGHGARFEIRMPAGTFRIP